MAAHRYWRLNIRSTGSADSNCSVAEIYGWAVGYDDSQLKGVTVVASNGPGAPYQASNCNNGNLADYWWTNAFVNATTLSFDLGVGVSKDIRQIGFYGRQDNNFAQCPKDYDWQWSDDNTTWTTAFSGTAPVPTAANQIYTSPSPGPSNSTRGTQSTTLGAITTLTTGSRNTQTITLTAINFPSKQIRETQGPVLAAILDGPDLRNTQTNILVAIFQSAAERTLRAWTFTQDDHDFYVIMAYGETYVYDKLTGEWAQWSSPDTVTPSYPTGYWRGIDGVEWDGINVCIDPDSGKVFKIDPTGRLDYGTTPITSQVVGGLTDRFRNFVPVYMAEVAISQAKPPAGVDPTTLGITLETYDTVNWTTVGTVNGTVSPTFTYPRFYGLGLIGSPGMLFRITDTGYARRIDGLNIEVGADRTAVSGNQ